MNHFLKILIVGSVITGAITSCSRNVTGGNPNLPLSNSNGVAHIFDVSQFAALAAITNAFSDNRYRGMLLEDARNAAYLVPDWHPKDGFVLSPFLGLNYDKNPLASNGGAITNIPLDSGKVVPYFPYFYITISQLGSNKVNVDVRTVLAQVIDGRETGVHGGWANHYRNVLSVRQEEENVLIVISNQMNSRANQSTRDANEK